jgi:hypothetical protein
MQRALDVKWVLVVNRMWGESGQVARLRGRGGEGRWMVKFLDIFVWIGWVRRCECFCLHFSFMQDFLSLTFSADLLEA